MRKLKFRHVLFALAITITLPGMVVTSAMAVDLTGTWEGGWICRGSSAVEPLTVTDQNVTLKVTQEGNELYMYEDRYECSYYGLVIEDLKSPDKKAEVIFIDCNTDISLQTYATQVPYILNEMGRGEATVGDEKGCLEMISICGGNESGSCWVETCDWKFKRVNTVNHDVQPCD